MTVTLRDYQHEAVSAAYSSWEAGIQRVALVLPTGAGKTVVFSEICSRWNGAHRMSAKQRVLVLVHREELAEQTRKTLNMMAPHLRVGIVAADRDNTTADVVIGMVQTLRNEKRRQRIVHVGLVIVDECHHSAATSYQAILEHYGAFSEYGARALGVTATMMRTDKLSLGDTWQAILYTKDIAWMVERGYLVEPVGKLITVSDLDLSTVRKKAGDFSDSALGEALEQSLAPDAVARAYKEHSPERKGILFAPTVHCAEVYAEAMNDYGFVTEVVHGKTPAGERKAIFDRLHSGKTQVLANCGIATEGTDVPSIGTVVIGRPTQSRGLFIQMAGRGLRRHPGKENCLVLVVAGKAARHSLTAPIELFGQERESLEELETELAVVLGEGLDLEEIIIPGQDLGPELPEWADGQHLHTRDLDLFRSSKATQWLQTASGHWFIPAGDRLILIRPQNDGTWGVLWCHREYVGEGLSGWIETRAPDMAWAMGIAEASVTTSEKLRSAQARSFKSRPANRTQIGIALQLGIAAGPNSKYGELAKAIDIAAGSRRIDPFMNGR